MLKEIIRIPFEGLGKSESPKHKYSGYWLRRMDPELWLIYRAEAGAVLVAKCRCHCD